ncbi:hypothetical protein PLESTB_001008000 [Pleodorina starrii]|uniref:Uncharacterized protein n=1 Tax=Pleodorina starrii TaxID=330485 RepID=A0A9W6BPA4_9CHLO|nr:hypothetical protein PLESTB_001008000 [Pleodorina starrii]GLC65373.1 hypothetical protein PLESTF_000286300 [Pleodorina starrii]
MSRGLQPSQRPSPTIHPMRFDGSSGGAGPDATPLISSTGPSPHLPGQRSLDGALATQHSWGSPRSDPVRSSDAGALEAFRSFSLGGLGLGSGSSGGGAQSKYVRPANVPPLNLGRLANREDLAAKQRSSGGRQGGAVPASPGAGGSGSGGGAPAPLTPHQYQQQLLESLADLEEELTSWAAPPRWNPTSQGRWYLYPPIGRKDVNPVEQLLETLAPNQASAVVLLWRQYAAARYSAELMAGRAVRLCRELGHELADCRAEVEERTQRHADHAAHLGKAVVRLQQQLDEARRAAAAATSAAAAATAAAAAQQNAESSQQQQQQDASTVGGLRLSQSLPAHSNSPARRQSSRNAVGVSPMVTHASGRGGGANSAQREKRPTGRDGLPEGMPAETEDLAVQLEQMRQLFLEAHEDSRALREALMEVDEQNMQLYEQSNGLRRHAAAVLRENDALRQEVAQLRGVLTGGGGGLAAAATAAAASTSAAATSASTAAAAAAADAGGVGGSAAASAASRRTRPQYSVKSTSGGGGGGGSTSETGMRSSVTLPLGIKDHIAAAASTTPAPRPPLSNAAGAAAVPPAPAAVASTPVSASGRRSDGGVTGAAGVVRTSVRRPVGSTAGADGPSSGAPRDPNAPPLPPARASSARAKSTTRGAAALSGGRSAAAAAGDQAATLYGSTEGALVKNSSGIGGGSATAERANRRALTEALAAEGAVVMVHASRRGIGANSGSGGGHTPPSRTRVSTESVPTAHSNFVTDAALMKAAAANGGGAFGSDGVGGALKYGAEERLAGSTASRGQALVRAPPVAP